MASSSKVSYVTQKDVARLANVSQAAVAAALGRTDKVRVGEKTREKILQAAARLNYTPNQSASVTRSGRTKQVALIVSGTMLQTVFLRLRYLANFLAEKEFTVIPHELEWTKRSLEQAWDEALAARAEGIVLSSSFGRILPAMHKRLLNSPVPVVSLCGPGIPGIPLIAPDLRKAFRELTTQLLRSGRKKLTFMRRYRERDPIEQIEWKREERTSGFLDAVKEFKAEKHCQIFEVHRDAASTNEHQLGEKGLAELLKKSAGKPPEVIICANDNIALGVVSQARRQGIDIPRQMEITGCDGEEWTGYGAMPITTIVQPAKALAQKAAEIIIERLGGTTQTMDPILLPCEIRWRESSLGDHHSLR